MEVSQRNREHQTTLTFREPVCQVPTHWTHATFNLEPCLAVSLYIREAAIHKPCSAAGGDAGADYPPHLACRP